MKRFKFDNLNDAPNVLVGLEADQMIFRTSSEGFYSFVQSEFNGLDEDDHGYIDGLDEILNVEVKAEHVEDGTVWMRVWATEYRAEPKIDRLFNNDDDPDEEETTIKP